MRSWPVISRSAHVDALVAALSARPARAQMLRGPSGIGKTTIAAAVSHTLGERGRTIVPVIALAELQHVPLGALAPLLGSSRFADIDDVGARLHELMALVGRHAESYLLVVDDAPLLDDASAAALYQLVRVFGVPCLMTARDEHALSGPIARLLHEDLVTVTETTGLSLDETRDLLRRRLGADPRPESLQRLYETTRGNPLFLRELVLAAERAGRISVGPFGVEVDDARLPAHIVDWVAGRLAELGRHERALAELIAVAQPWPSAATRPRERDALESLVAAGIVAGSGPDESGYLQLTHPVFAEALLTGLDAEGRSTRRREAAARLLALDAPQLRFTALCLRDDAGDDLDVNDLVWASGYAHAAGDHDRAASAARRAIERATPDSDLTLRCRARLALGAALSSLGELDAADDAFTAAAADAELVVLSAGDDTALAAARGLRAAVHLRWGQHTALRRTAPRQAAERMEAVLAELDDDGRQLLAPDIAKWRLMAGDTDVVATVVSAPAPGPEPEQDAAAESTTGPGALNAAIGAAMMATMSGRTTEAAAAVEAGRPLAAQHADVLPFADSLLDLNTFLIDVGDGRIAEARAFAEQRRLDPFADSAGLWSYALALVHLHAGRLHDAQPLARLAVEQLRWRDFTGLLGPAIALAATVAAQLGEAAEAEALLGQPDAAHLDDVKVTLQTAEARAWLALGRGDATAAIEGVGAAVARGAELGHLLLTALTASVGVRAGGGAAFADALAGFADYSGCALVVTIADTARAWRDEDAAAALELAPRIQGIGLDALALDTVRAALDWAAGERMLARRARVLAAELALTVVAPRRSRNAREQSGLTEREWVIAQAAARRERSREIADRLGVSVRTVDNHLANVYRKLGIAGRTELEQELREFL